MKTAADAALAHQLQLWDAVICACASQAGAKVLLTEDLQHGRLFQGLRFVNPFDAGNDTTIAALFAD
jgi:predicted nucleic acid-binding protein